MKYLLLFLLCITSAIANYTISNSTEEYLELNKIMKTNGYDFKVTTSEGRYSHTFYAKEYQSQNYCIRLTSPVIVQTVSKRRKMIFTSKGPEIICGSYYIIRLKD